MAGKKKKIVLSPSDLKLLDPTSSLQNHFMCLCGVKFVRKGSLVKHLKTCNGKTHSLVCKWCKIRFKNKGNLVIHSLRMHGDKSIQKAPNTDSFNCNVCEAKFTEKLRLRYHIRKEHYNLMAITPLREDKKINQIWFEKVLNSDRVMKIKKTGANTLVMKPLPNTGIQIRENNERIDLTALYPTGRRTREETCKICHKTYKKIDIKKHMDEKHLQNFKMKCNNCQRLFKRMYIYLHHVCGKQNLRNSYRRQAGVIQYGNKIKIAKVTSLKAFEVD